VAWASGYSEELVDIDEGWREQQGRKSREEIA
jgi:hypothetical protein